MFVKICGITNQVDAELAIAAGADALGFNFWPGSRHYLEAAKATDWIKELPHTIVRVGVVVNPSKSYAMTIAATDGIDLLQLHGAESPEFCLNLLEAGVVLWKAIPMTGPETSLPDYHAKRIVLDTFAGRKFGGTGVHFRWPGRGGWLPGIRALRLFLVVGLRRETVTGAIPESGRFGVIV